MMFRTFVLASAVVATGCTSGISTDKTDDTAVDSGDTDTDVIDTDTDTTPVDVTPTWNTNWANGWEDAIDCGTANEVTISAETNNWGFAAAMWMTATRFTSPSAYSEQHTMEELNSIGNNDGTGSTEYARTLSTTPTTPGGVTLDSSTLWNCDGAPSLNPTDSGNFQVTWALAVWGEDDNPASDAPADCIVFGQDPAGLLADPTSDSRTVPAWFSAANCTNVNGD